MSDTTKTILIAGGALAGLFVIYRLSSGGSSGLLGSPNANRPTGAAGVIAALSPALAVGINNLTRPSTSTTSAALVSYGTGTNQAPSVPEGFDTSNYTTSDGFMYTDSNGGFVAG